MNTESPVNSIPPAVLALCLIAVAVELVLSAGAAGLAGDDMALGWRSVAVQDYAFTASVMDWIAERGDYSFAVLKPFVTYPFVHLTFTSALFGSALLLALGKFVGDAIGNVPVLVLFFVTSVGGAFVFGVLTTSNFPLMGLYPPVFGLIGAYTYVIWVRMGQMGENQLNAFRLIGVLLGLQLVFGLIFGSSQAWIAEIAAFAIGFGLSPVLVPGGLADLRRKLRDRR